MEARERLKSLSDIMAEKENLPTEVSQLLTPGRRPLKAVQENLLGTPELSRSLKNRQNSLTPSRLQLNAIVNKTKRNSKRLSIPVHVFRRSLKEKKPIISPLVPSSSEQRTADVRNESKICFRRRSVLPSQKLSKVSIDHVEVGTSQSKETKGKPDEAYLDSFAEGFVNGVLNGIVKEYQKNKPISEPTTNRLHEHHHITETSAKQYNDESTGQHTELKSPQTSTSQVDHHPTPCEQHDTSNHQIDTELNEQQATSHHQNNDLYKTKMEEYTNIILQMNKERLQLEKQLSDCKKELSKMKTRTTLTSKMLPSSQKHKKSAINKSENEQHLRNKNLEIQKLQKELQLFKTNKTSFETKKEEARQLRVEINQLQHQIRELPKLKTELQKSRQQVIQLNDVVTTCRRENSSQTSLLEKLEKELSAKESRVKQYVEDNDKIRKDLCDSEEEISRLQKMVFASEEENRICQVQCENLYPLLDRLELVSEQAEKFKASAQKKVFDLNQCLSEKTNLCDDLQEQLQNSRSESSAYQEECARLKHQITELTSEVDIGQLEISRQQGVISKLEEQLNKLRTENCMYQEHLELIQCQHQEENLFLEEEKKAIQETAKEMEKELVTTKQKGQKVEELEQEVKFSRSLVMEKQEELDATQSQAHCIIQQLQNEITDAQEALNELWDIIGPLLNKFREQAQLDSEQEKVQEVPQGLCTSTPGKSLVQSVLSAAAQVNEGSHGCDDSIMTLCNQIDDLKQGLLELADIGHGKKASHQALEQIKQLQDDRESLESEYTTAINHLKSEVNAYRTNESNQTYTLQQQQRHIDSLTTTLNNTKEDLRKARDRNDAMNGLLEAELEYKKQIWDLTDQLNRKEREHKRLMSEKECMDEQIKEATRKMNEISETGNHDAGKLLEEKFLAERKLKEFKDKWIEYRLKTDDTLNDYKLDTNKKIRNLEMNVKEAEDEIFRLDDILQKIRQVLRNNLSVVDQSPSLSKVLQFLNNGGNSQQ